MNFPPPAQKSIIKSSININQYLKKLKINKKIINKTIFIFLILLFTINFALAIPNTLTLQGKLTDISGSSLQGTYNMSFRIYDSYTDGNILWQLENYNVSTDANGVYDVIFKDVNLNFSDEYYLGIIVGDDNESVPRVNLTSSPYAFRSNISEDLNPENKYTVSVFNITGNLTIGTLSDDVLTITTGRFNVSDGNLDIGGNLSLSERITFSLGGIIDNIVNGWLKITGNLNITEGLRVEKNISLGYENATVEIISDRFNVSNGTIRAAGNLTLGNKIRFGLGEIIDNLVDSFLTITGGLNVTESLIVKGGANITGDLGVSGKVGVGTTTPTTELDVKGKLNVTGNTSIAQDTLFVDNTSSRVGIGTAAPGAKLEIAGGVTGASPSPTLKFANYYDNAGDASVSHIQLYDGYGFGISGSRLNIITTSGADIAFMDGTDVNMYIDNGNVGIGTTAPLNTLHVNGSGAQGGFRVTNESGQNIFFVNSTSGNVGVGTTSPKSISNNADRAVEILGTARGTSFIVAEDDESRWVALWSGYSTTDDSGIVWDSDSDLKFGTETEIKGTYSEKMRITTAGNVGIGNTIPNASLDVSGNVYLSAANPYVNLSGPVIRKSGDDIVISD